MKTLEKSWNKFVAKLHDDVDLLVDNELTSYDEFEMFIEDVFNPNAKLKNIENFRVKNEGNYSEDLMKTFDIRFNKFLEKAIELIDKDQIKLYIREKVDFINQN